MYIKVDLQRKEVTTISLTISDEADYKIVPENRSVEHSKGPP